VQPFPLSSDASANQSLAVPHGLDVYTLPRAEHLLGWSCHYIPRRRYAAEDGGRSVLEVVSAKWLVGGDCLVIAVF
jgi:hypothetical protein